jgi:hypothetical protein
MNPVLLEIAMEESILADRVTPFQRKVANLAELTVFFGGAKVWTAWEPILEGLALSHGVDQEEASACFFLAVASFSENGLPDEAL